MKKLVTVVGNRPQFIKAAVVRRKIDSTFRDSLSEYLVHTGQHYDPMLSDVFFRELAIPEPHENLNIGSGPISTQIGRMLPEITRILREQKPDGVLVYGDTNSTAATAIAAAHLHIPIFHVEGGERNFRRELAPEEVNRCITDELSWKCLTSTNKAKHYLLREGYHSSRVTFVGDPMYDLFCWGMENADRLGTLDLPQMGLQHGCFALATIHRNENTTEKSRLLEILEALDGAALPTLLPLHPRVRNLLQEYGWSPQRNLRLTEPLGYFDILRALNACVACVTDSGGLSREAFFAGKPVIIPLPNTVWNEIAEAGWAKAVPSGMEALRSAVETFRPTALPPAGLFGDGDSGTKICSEIISTLERRGSEGAWHPLGTFANISQPVDRSAFSHSHLASASPHLKSLTLIHPIGIDSESCRALAEIEDRLSIRATFLVQPMDDLLNPLSPQFRDTVLFIRAKGHTIAVSHNVSRSIKTALEHFYEFELIDFDPMTPQTRANLGMQDLLGAAPGTTVWLDPAEWSAIPVSPFEQRQRAAYSVYERLLSRDEL